VELRLVESGGGLDIVFEATALVIAGWTGRDAAQVEHHVAELERIGVQRPTAIPTFYRVGRGLLTSASGIEVVGNASSGEVEFVLFGSTELLVGIGSDHTDRKLETISVAQSKQVCPKPIGPELWRFAEVEEHWDQLELRSFATIGGQRRRYQDGGVDRMLHPCDLMGRFAAGGTPAQGTVMFCGTLPVEGEISPCEVFEIELHDPVLGRSLTHKYRIEALPAIS
jgi:uncharacterized protein DUF2848